MTREKDLLLKDLCTRIPYRVKCHIEGEDGAALRIGGYIEACGIHAFNFIIGEHKRLDFKTLEEIKPYLFPLSSMTEEQRREYDKIIYHSIELHHREYSDIVEIDLFEDLQEFYHKNHFDYRGLIPMGLAIDCTNLNIY